MLKSSEDAPQHQKVSAFGKSEHLQRHRGSKTTKRLIFDAVEHLRAEVSLFVGKSGY